MYLNSLTKIPISLALCALLISTITVKGILPESLYVKNEAFGKTSTCKCVVFRLDDVQDRYLDLVNIKILNLFLSRDTQLSIGLVMYSFGDDNLILNKISDGNKKGLFELALHGWEHKNYPGLTQQEQKSSLYNANEKMELLFGKRSDVFVPPYNKFNNITLDVMKELGIKIISSNLYEENNFDQGSSIFNSNTKNQSSRVSQHIYHLPYTTPFKKFVGPSQIKVPIDEVVKDIHDKIDRLGYAIVQIHPQSFIKLDKTGTFGGDIDQAQIDERDIKDLEYLIDYLTKKNIKITSFHNIIDT
jgi:peptidoglycan/xylan/chitin deacetylase (PgdA/CDA1 family)